MAINPGLCLFDQILWTWEGSKDGIGETTHMQTVKIAHVGLWSMDRDITCKQKNAC